MKQLTFYEYLKLPERSDAVEPGWYRDSAKPEKVYKLTDGAWQTYTWSPHPSPKDRGVDVSDAPRKSRALRPSVGKIDLLARLREYLAKQGQKPPRTLRQARAFYIKVKS